MPVAQADVLEAVSYTHLYKDMNSIYLLYKGGLRLYLFCDIYYAFKNLSLDLDVLWQHSQRLSVAPYLYYLSLIHI